MSIPGLDMYGRGGEAPYPDAVSTELGTTSPFAPVGLAGGAVAAAPAPPPGQVLQSPFAEAAVGADDGRYAAEAVEALVAELADDGFAEALEALADEGAARHLRSVGTWSSDSEAPALATADTTQWLEQLAGETDRVLGALEAHFGDRPVDSLRDGELEAVSGVTGLDSFTDPADAQQLWFGSLLKKGFNLAKGLAQKGIALAGKLALGPLFGVLRKLVKPLLRKVLDSAIGRLPRRSGRWPSSSPPSSGAAARYRPATRPASRRRSTTASPRWYPPPTMPSPRSCYPSWKRPPATRTPRPRETAWTRPAPGWPATWPKPSPACRPPPSWSSSSRW